jgi:nucleoside-diphosphate-sugar epimerase
MPTILVTGAGGFLGRHMVRTLAGAGWTVRALDRTFSPDETETQVERLVVDVRTPGILEEVLDGTAAVVHAAFASPREPREAIDAVNVAAVGALCDAALRRGAHLVLVSSTIVERPPLPGPIPPGSPLARLEAYRQSRIEAERRVEEAARRGLRAAILRPKTFLGPDRVGAFAWIFGRIHSGGAVPILGRGTNRYQLLDVRDLAAGVALLVERRREGVFHFGAAEFGTVREDLEALVEHAATGSRLVSIPSAVARRLVRAVELFGLEPLPEWHRASAFGEDSVVDIARAWEELGWRPERSNRAALVEAWDGYRRTVETGAEPKLVRSVPSAHRWLGGVAGAVLRFVGAFQGAPSRTVSRRRADS